MIRHYSKNIQDIIQRELFAAQDSIKIAVAWFTNDLLFYPLLHKLMAGVKVELMLNKDDVNFSVSNIVDFDQFLQQGGVLYLNETKRLLHDKFCIIDNRIVINGSYNWTNGAKHNYETITVFTDELESVIHHKALFDSLKKEFTRRESSPNIPTPRVVAPETEKSETRNRITYTSSDGCIVVPNKEAHFEANIVSNTYENGNGVVVFDREITVIPTMAFYKCSKLKSVAIPEGVISIGDSAFSDCSNLTSVVIPEGVTSIGEYAFYGCSSLTSVMIPESVTSIRKAAFRDCSSLTSVVIPESVTSIGIDVFYGCSSLVKFEGNFASDDGRCLIVNGDLKAFAPYGLTSYAIPNGVTSIGGDAFIYCSNLTNVVIPEGVTSIGYSAFAYCSGLTSVVIPESVTSIGLGVFYGCSSLVKFEGNFASDDGRSLIENGMLRFFAPYGLTSYAIPNGVTLIAYEAFDGCSSLTSVVIPESVTSIGGWAFSGCRSLTSIVIPESVTSIRDSAFSGCRSLTSIVIPESVTSIGNSAFSGCRSLTSIVIPEGVTSIGRFAFYGCSSLASVVIPESVTSIGDYAFRDCSSLASVVIPVSLTSIGRFAFYGCSSPSAVFPKGVTSICHIAAEDCQDFGSVVIPEGVTTIGDAAFSGWAMLTSVVIPKGVTSIGGSAFSCCFNLASVVIPESVTSIGYQAFELCHNLRHVYCMAFIPPTLRASSLFSLSRTFPEHVTICVPRQSEEAYKEAKVWRDYADAIIGYDF